MSTRRTYQRLIAMLNEARTVYPNIAIVAAHEHMWYVLSSPIETTDQLTVADEPTPPYSYGSGLWEAVEGFVESVVRGNA